MNSSCRHSGKVEQVLELDSAVYGNPAATRMFQNKNTKVITQDCGLNESKVAGALYYKVKFNSNTNRKATTIIDACILVGTHVDDLLLTGSMSMKQDFMTKYTKAMGGHVTWENPGTKFTACELKQDLKRGTFEMTQTAYWDAAGKRFSPYLTGHKKRNPVLPSVVWCDPKTISDEDFKKAKHLPFAELVGTLNYPSQYTKLECQLAVSKLSRYMQKWTVETFATAVGVLGYCITTKKIGLIWSRDLDKHGVNILYSHADSGFNPDRSTGCRYLMANGSVISALG